MKLKYTASLAPAGMFGAGTRPAGRVVEQKVRGTWMVAVKLINWERFSGFSSDNHPSTGLNFPRQGFNCMLLPHSELRSCPSNSFHANAITRGPKG